MIIYIPNDQVVELVELMTQHEDSGEAGARADARISYMIVQALGEQLWSASQPIED